MMVRKPTKIELKPEDDLYEYEEYKKKQQELSKKPAISDAKQSSKLPDKMIIEPNSNPFKMSLANEIFKTPSIGVTVPHNLNPTQPISNSSSQFDSFNLIRSQVGGQDFDVNNIRNDSPHINQLFSLLLNNLNSGQTFNNLYSSGNVTNTDPNNPNNNNHSG